jgi:hypothetical protein
MNKEYGDDTMRQVYLVGSILLIFVLLFGCSSGSQSSESSTKKEQVSESSTNEKSSTAPIEKEDAPSSTSTNDTVSLEDMELLKETLRTYIFDEYMPGPDYVYAKGVNWTENFYDNLTAEEVWKVIEEYKELNNGKDGTLFEQASYLSEHAPIKDNWKELFLENWKNSSLSQDFEIDTLINNGETVGVYTNANPYTGGKENNPMITLNTRTGYWHG